jgi:hypothetical protein
VWLDVRGPVFERGELRGVRQGLRGRARHRNLLERKVQRHLQSWLRPVERCLRRESQPVRQQMQYLLLLYSGWQHHLSELLDGQDVL